MLGIVVKAEKRELEERREKLVVQDAQNRAKLEKMICVVWIRCISTVLSTYCSSVLFEREARECYLPHSRIQCSRAYS